jgi:DnaJ-class molecular chaperone
MFARLIVFVLLFVGVTIVIRWLLRSDGTVRCTRCEGKGYWYGAREREKCDWCKGSGRMPRF